MGSKKEFPSNWKEVREKIKNKEISVTAGIDEMGISKSMYYALVDYEKTNGEEPITPQVYFKDIKNSVQNVQSADLKKSFEVASKMMESYEKAGQTKSMSKLERIMDVIAKEQMLIDLGVDRFVYRQDVEKFIEKIEKKTVEMIDLEDYERPIPPEITEVISEVKDIFDRLIVVFTDYTGKVEKQVQKERREKDPILFGLFINGRTPLSDRFYYLGDWEDEYCDLTLESMISEFSSMTGENMQHEISTPTTDDALRKRIEKFAFKEEEEKTISTEDLNSRYTEERDFREKNEGEKFKEIFKKVRSILNRK